MSEFNSNQAKVRRAIEQLRSEVPEEGAHKRLQQKMTQRRAGLRWLPAVATVSAVGLGVVVVIWPSRPAMGWQEVVRATLGSIRLHRTDYEMDKATGKWYVAHEFWLDGQKRAMNSNFKNSTDLVLPRRFDSRFDGQRNFLLRGTYGEVFNPVPLRNPVAPTWTKFYDMNSLLSNPMLNVSAPESGKLDGKDVSIYNGTLNEKISNMHMKIYVDPSSAHVLRTEYYDPDGKMEDYWVAEYPTSISNDHFEPPKGIKVYDLDKEADHLRQILQNRTPIGGGNEFRAIIKDDFGGYVILWTGTPPSSDLTQFPRVVGHSCSQVYSPDQLNTSRWKFNPKAFWYIGNQPLCGISMSFKPPIGDHVDLRMPILTEDRSHPMRDEKGTVRGYQSKILGWKVLKNVRVEHAMWASALNFLHKVPSK